MSINYTFRPIESTLNLPQRRAHKRSGFTATHYQTMQLLESELGKLKAKNVVIQADCDLSQIRQDGMLRSQAKLRSPAIILSFDSKHGPLSYPCNTYTRWQCNLRAIALALEALRKVDRYGVTSRSEQYKGWAKIEASEGNVILETVRDAISFISSIIGQNFSPKEPYISNAIRKAKRITHPDQGGDSKKFILVTTAEQIIRGQS